MGAARALARVRRGAVLVVVVALAAALLVAVRSADRADAALPPGFTSTPVFTGLNQPTAIAFSPDGKVYTAEKG